MLTGKELGMTIRFGAEDVTRLGELLAQPGPDLARAQAVSVNGFEVQMSRVGQVCEVQVRVPGFVFAAHLGSEQMGALAAGLSGGQAPLPVQMSCFDEGLGDYIRIDEHTVATQPVYFVNAANPGIALSASGTAISE